MKRQRGRGRKPSNSNNRSYESNGPDVKIRGSASQVYEKYLQYGRDAQTSGDRINAEALFQHAEHYYRIMVASMPKDRLPHNMDQDQNGDQDNESDDDRDDDNGDYAEESPRQQTYNKPASSENLRVVDGEGEQPEEIASSKNEGETTRRRYRRPTRRPTEDRATKPEDRASKPASEGEGDDAGLRAMMARTKSQESAEKEQADS